MTPPRSSVARPIARVLAVAVALIVLGWLVLRAQRSAPAENTRPADPTGDPVIGEPISDPRLLNTSKSLVIDPDEPAALDSENAQRLLMPSSKSGPVPEAATPSAPRKQ